MKYLKLFENFENESIYSIKIDELGDYIKRNFESIIGSTVHKHIPHTLLYTTPGMGVTNAISNIAKELGVEFKNIILSDLEYEEMLPLDNSHWIPNDGEGIILFSDIDRASGHIISEIFQMIFNSKIPKGWMVIFTHTGSEVDIPSAVLNRMNHLKLELNTTED